MKLLMGLFILVFSTLSFAGECEQISGLRFKTDPRPHEYQVSLCGKNELLLSYNGEEKRLKVSAKELLDLRKLTKRIINDAKSTKSEKCVKDLYFTYDDAKKNVSSCSSAPGHLFEQYRELFRYYYTKHN